MTLSRVPSLEFGVVSGMRFGVSQERSKSLGNPAVAVSALWCLERAETPRSDRTQRIEVVRFVVDGQGHAKRYRLHRDGAIVSPPDRVVLGCSAAAAASVHDPRC